MTRPTLLSKGNFASVFDLGDGTVAKVFRRNRHTARTDVPVSDDDLLTRGFCAAEANAYEALQAYPELSVYTPRYYGRVDPLALDLPLDTERHYLAGCGIVLERLVGTEHKFHELDQALESQVDAVVQRMQEHVALGHPWDGSCFIPGTRAPLALIDFATWDGWGPYYDTLEKEGRLSDSEREQLSTFVGAA